MAHFVKNLFFTLAAGAAGGAAATLLRRDGAKAHPLAKTAVVAGLRAYESMRGAVAELSETMTEIVAEAQSEIQAEREPRADEAQEHVVPFEARSHAEAEKKAHG